MQADSVSRFQNRQTRRIPSGCANTHPRVKEKNAENFGESERHIRPTGNTHNTVSDYAYLALCQFATMTKICEVTVLYLKPGTDLSPPKNHDKYTTGIKTLTSQPGFRLLQEGRSMIEEELLVWLIDWNDLLDHEAFMAKSEPYSKMVDALLSMCDTERKDFLEIKHLPPSSSFLDVTLTGPQSANQLTTILWLRTPEGGSLGQFAAAVKKLRGELEHRGQTVSGGGPVETPGEAILFIQFHDGAPGLEKEEIVRILGHGANISRYGVFNMSNHA